MALSQNTYLQISDIVVKVKHTAEIFSRTFLSEHQSLIVSGPRRVDAVIEILENKSPLLPPRAVLTGRWPLLQMEEYKIGNAVAIINPDGMVYKNYRNRHVLVIANGAGILDCARVAAKWLIIKTAERKNHAFIHASALNYQGHSIVFAGDSGSGKTSFMLRTAQMGARVLCDDALLAKRGQLTPYLMKITKKGDFKNRFVGKTKILPALKSVRGIDFLVFPRIWNHGVSRVVRLNKKLALNELWRIYQKEAGWNAHLEPEKNVRKKYSELIQNTKCFVFYAGKHEKEVCVALRKFLYRECEGGL